MKKLISLMLIAMMIMLCLGFSSAETKQPSEIRRRLNSGLSSRDDGDVRSKVLEICEECRASGASGEVAIALWLHNWLTANANYDYTYSEYDLDGVLLKGKGVCMSYTLAYQLLLDEFGIENQYVVSDEMNHMWSLVKLEGTWYHVDVTWDDPNQGGYENTAYFGLSDATMRRDHTRDEELPECPKDLVFSSYGREDLTEPYPVSSGKTPPELSVCDASGTLYTQNSFPENG